MVKMTLTAIEKATATKAKMRQDGTLAKQEFNLIKKAKGRSREQSQSNSSILLQLFWRH